MLKRLIVAAAGLALSAPALAEGRHHRHGYRPVQHHHYIVHRPVYTPVYYHYHYRPAPVVQYHYSSPAPGAALVVGAVLGAVVAHHLVTHY